jgi:hypothetical protein
VTRTGLESPGYRRDIAPRWAQGYRQASAQSEQDDPKTAAALAKKSPLTAEFPMIALATTSVRRQLSSILSYPHESSPVAGHSVRLPVRTFSGDSTELR